MRIEQLTFTRFLAAIAIVLFHFCQNIFPFNTPALNFLVANANVGVSYFFILSGFVMILAYGDRKTINFGDFVKRRFARIYPVHLLAIVILLVYFVIINAPSSAYRGLPFVLTLIQSWIPGVALSVNPPSWSLSTEMFFYIIFPLLFNNLYKTYPSKYLFIIVAIFFIASQVVLAILFKSSFYNPNPPSTSHDFLFYSPIMHINEFLVGNMVGLFFIENKIKTRNYDLPIIGLLVLLILVIKYNKTFFIFHNGLLAFIFVPFILLLSANNGFITKFANMKIPVFLGEISYSIYILQYAVFTLWGESSVKNNATFFYLYLISLIIVAALSFKYLETPLRKIINKFNMERISFWIKNNKSLVIVASILLIIQGLTFVFNKNKDTNIPGKLSLGLGENIDGWSNTYINWEGHSLVMGSPVGNYAYNSVDLRPGGCQEAPLWSQLRMYTATSKNIYDLRVQVNTMGNTWFNQEGNFGIGLSDPKEKLEVNGTVKAKEFRVDIASSTDTVFRKGYKLMPLSELRKYVNTHKHLPGVALATEMESSGINLGEMNALLLKKIEELTLYIIEQKEKIEDLEQRLK